MKVVKAKVAGEENKNPSNVAISNRIPDDPFSGSYGDIIEPPQNLEYLARLSEHSNMLGQCIEAMKMNIDGFGYTLELEDGIDLLDSDELTPEALAEKRRINRFFQYIHPNMSYVKLRKEKRIDLEITGNAYWEIIRDGKNDIVGIEPLESYTMRLTRLDETYTDVMLKIKNEHNEYEEIPYKKRFRRFVQMRNNKKVYFKEFGDPRSIDASTGKVLGENTDSSPTFIQANEVIHFSHSCPYSPYGIPRWLGALLSIIGSRKSEEVNNDYFDNKSIPPLAILVNGKLASDSVERIENYVEEQLKGQDNFHKILILEVEESGSPIDGGSRKPGSVELVPLTNTQQKDALFLEYDDKNQDKIRSAFRLPPLYVGKAQDYNRATAEEAKRIAEEQIFGPERDDHDFIVNRLLFTEMSVRFWKYKSLSAKNENPRDMADMLGIIGKEGLTAREARRFIEKIINKELPDPEGAEWLDMPLSVYIEQSRKNDSTSIIEEIQKQGEVDDPQLLVQYLVNLRKELDAYESTQND